MEGVSGWGLGGWRARGGVSRGWMVEGVIVGDGRCMWVGGGREDGRVQCI